ncbi:hypothetical protein BTN45_11315 [Rhizobium sp. ZX09]|nr:hypothetical protein BTN45_11315 [Rhizobium sp. ZX09]
MCLKPGLHRLQNPLPPFDTPAAMRPLFLFPTLPRNPRRRYRRMFINRARCTKMKTGKIVAIGLKRLKTVLCHCGITDGERPLKETLHN